MTVLEKVDRSEKGRWYILCNACLLKGLSHEIEMDKMFLSEKSLQKREWALEHHM